MGMAIWHDPFDELIDDRERQASRSLPTAVEDQQLLLDEHGFGHDGPHAAGPGEPSDGRQQMQEKDGQLTHR